VRRVRPLALMLCAEQHNNACDHWAVARTETSAPGYQCPLWVKSRHFAMQKPCPLYPRKRTCAVQLRMSALGPIAGIRHDDISDQGRCQHRPRSPPGPDLEVHPFGTEPYNAFLVRQHQSCRRLKLDHGPTAGSSQIMTGHPCCKNDDNNKQRNQYAAT